MRFYSSVHVFLTLLSSIKNSLILCVSTEGGEIQTDEFDCPPEETMSQCGVGDSKISWNYIMNPNLKLNLKSKDNVKRQCNIL